MLAALQGIRDARRISDWPRVKFLQLELQDLANRLSIPLYVLGHVTVPNLTPIQNSAIHRVIRASHEVMQHCSVGETSATQGRASGTLQPSHSAKSF